MIVDSPPFQMKQKMFGGLCQRPGLSHQGSDPTPDAQVDPLDEGGLNDRQIAMLLQKIVQAHATAP